MTTRIIWRIPFILLLTAFYGVCLAQDEVQLTSSNLPIVVIDTQGQVIRNSLKITAHMGIINNGAGKRNRITDAFNEYDGTIGIEYRGDSSMQFPKKQFAVETRDSLGANLNISLFNMPEENDWVLYAPYSDKSLMRNVLAYKLSTDLNHYAARTQFCEVVLNGEYWGVYVFMEKIKRDKGRVAIAKLDSTEVDSLDVTGGYIIKVDKSAGENVGGWRSDSPLYYPGGKGKIFYQYHYPKPKDIQPEQEAYIQNYIYNFETMMLNEGYDDPGGGMWTAVDMWQAMDYAIVNEVCKNVDGYRLSAYLYKDRDDKDPRLHIGPVWDFNLAFGNADYHGAASPSGWQIEFFMYTDYFNLGGDAFMMPFWWGKMWDSPRFQNKLYQRWWDVRHTVFDVDALMNFIDKTAALLDEAQERNFRRWPILNERVWPNVYIGGTYANEVNYLKEWLLDRIEWMDDHTVFDPTDVKAKPSFDALEDFVLLDNYPNPFNSQTVIPFQLKNSADVKIEIFDVKGRLVDTLINESKAAGAYSLVWQGRDFSGQEVASGVYSVRLTADKYTETSNILLLR